MLIWETLGDTGRLSAGELTVPPGINLYPMIPNQSDEPEHRHYRKAILPFFLPRQIKALQESVRALAFELIEGFRPLGRCEFMGEFARHLPMLIFLRLVELPAEDREWPIARADLMVRSNDHDARTQSERDVEAYLGTWIEQRRAHPGEDMLSAIVHATVGDRPMTAGEVMGESMDVLFGGLDTVASMLGFVMRHLASQPAQRHQLIDEPALISIAIKEMFRRFAVATVARRVTADIEHEGVTMRAGDMVALPTCLHGIDETLWHAPLDADFKRPRRTHATFGTGIHTCPGAPLARSEIARVLEEWLARIPDFTIAPDDNGHGLTGSVNAPSSLTLECPVAA